MIASHVMPAARDWILSGVAVTVAAPLVAGGLAALGVADRFLRPLSVAAMAISFVASLAIALAWQVTDGTPVAFGAASGDGQLIFIDGLNAVLLPYVGLVLLAIVLVAPRRSLESAMVKRLLLGAAATFALFATSHPLVLVVLWAVTAQLTWRSTRVTPGGRPAARVFAISMWLALACMAAGTALLVADPPWERSSGLMGTAGGWLVAVAVMLRKGIFPFHSWYPALFSGAPMATALAATMPQVASYTAVRLLVGHADGVATELEFLALFALVTAVYGAALALVQRDLRGFIGALAMSQSALVLAGLSGRLPMELNGAFCVWISSGLAITGIGLVTWALESRAGDISLETLQGRFWDAPALAAFFLLFGMAAIGLPGTLSFVADDLIVSGSLDDQLHAGLMVIASTVLCGIAVMRCWFHVFGGPSAVDSPQHAILPRERLTFTALIAALFVLGIWPGPLVQALEKAAEQVLRAPAALPPPPLAPPSIPAHPAHGAATQHLFPGSLSIMTAPSVTKGIFPC
ncbi:MAG: proton-conducting transporter membrane subunit [Pirellulales bacterium]